jgi:hypothetical protein
MYDIQPNEKELVSLVVFIIKNTNRNYALASSFLGVTDQYLRRLVKKAGQVRIDNAPFERSITVGQFTLSLPNPDKYDGIIDTFKQFVSL